VLALVDATSFSELVHEAFIAPLRSVLIVDDQYPTWEEILNSRMEGGTRDDALESRSASKDWIKLPSEPLNVIREFRSAKPGFVIDIHDALAPSPTKVSGTTPPESPSELADHLHQSDLLVLDYNLEGEVGSLRGLKAREILRSILTNRHFNLVIVHTGEDDLKEVISECLLSLVSSCSASFDAGILGKLSELDERLDELEAGEAFDRKRLQTEFAVENYLSFRECEGDKRFFADYMQGKGPLAGLQRWAAELGLERGDQKTFLWWALREFEKGHGVRASETSFEGLCWSVGDSCKWLRASRGFVAFVKKGPDDLLSELQKALEDWKPTPSRLLSAKYRHSLSSVGVEAEDRSLLNPYIFAQFYDNIMEPARSGVLPAQALLARQFKLKEHVSRQSEGVAFLIENELVEFGEKIVQTDQNNGRTFASHYGIDLTDKKVKRAAVDQFNSYVSTLPQKSGPDQLDCGHVFKLGADWWVCATPACDLQPGQNSIAFVGQSNDLRPFTALQLVQMKADELENDNINSGSCCFVYDDTEQKVVCLGLRSTSDERKPATQKVTWRTFLAKGQGLISDRKCDIIQLKLGEDGIQQSLLVGQIIGKLRYEYALNYIQRVGASVSRIGLGYSSYPES